MLSRPLHKLASRALTFLCLIIIPLSQKHGTQVKSGVKVWEVKNDGVDVEAGGI
jgi:hypothetical protein